MSFVWHIALHCHFQSDMLHYYRRRTGQKEKVKVKIKVRKSKSDLSDGEQSKTTDGRQKKGDGETYVHFIVTANDGSIPSTPPCF